MALDDYFAVIDSSALVHYLFEELANTRLKKLVDKSLAEHKSLVISSINWCEIYYVTYRKVGATQAEKIIRNPEMLNIRVIHTNNDVVMEASRIKVSFPQLAIADCFVAALARVFDKRLITCDHDFMALGKRVKLSFIRV